jgi:MoaA/NifB/PqqE/SkfB family radical SAM enzyme
VDTDSFDALSPLPQQPGTLLLHLLNRCNLHCRHCYLDASPQKDVVLPAEIVEGALAQLSGLGIDTAFFSGGEPFLYKDLPRVLAAASSQQNLAVVVCTNGTLIGSEEADLLRDHVVRVQVSGDGPEAFHDRFRGRTGAFRDMARGIALLTERGVPVKLVSTISRANYRWLPWIAQWASDQGIDQLSIQPLMLVGRGAELSDEALDTAQLCDLFLRLSDLGQVYRERGLRFSLTYRTRRFLLAHPCAAFLCDGERCHRHVDREIKKLVVREDGTVLPEIPTLSYRYALGNLRDAPLADLVRRYFDDGYERFKTLCRRTYQDTVPKWSAPLVPWEDLVSAYSRSPLESAVPSTDALSNVAVRVEVPAERT